jgi:tetratricopeptide (TPR) repeat protein
MRLKLLISIALLTATFILYWQVGSHEFLIYDDDLYISRNVHVLQGLSGENILWALTSVEQCNWHPLTWMSHMLDAQLFGISPHGHHLMNVGYHGIAVLFLFYLLNRLTRNLWRSAFVAALFALHPLHVESVAWAAERKDVLSACFGFLTLLLYVRYVETRRSKTYSGLYLYLLTLFTFMLGLMSKPMLVTLPLVMLMLDYWPLQRFGAALPPDRTIALHKESPYLLLKEKIPFALCAVISSAVTFYAQHTGGAVVALDWIPLTLRLQNALVAYLAYITKTFWPRDLAVLYPFSNPIPMWQVGLSAVVLLVISVASIRFGRRWPWLPVGWFWYLVTLLPVIGIVQVGNQAMADRYAYIPTVGLYILISWGVPTVSGAFRKPILILLAGLVLCASAIVAWQQIGYWKNNITLFSHALQVTSGNHIIHYNLGIAYARSGNPIAAITEFHAAVKLRPNDSKLRNLLASTLAENGYVEAALSEYAHSLAITPNNQEASYALEYWRNQKEKNSARIGQ